MCAKRTKVSGKRGKARDVIQVAQAGLPPYRRSSQPGGLIHTDRQFRKLFERIRIKSDSNGIGFSLVIFDVDGIRPRHLLAGELEQALVCRLRPTDNAGWLDDERLGILLPGKSDRDAHRLANEIRAALSKEAVFPRGRVYSYPSDWPLESRNNPKEVIFNPTAYTTRPDKAQAPSSDQEIDSDGLGRQTWPVWKRAIDIGGALIGLAVLSPVMLVITVLIKIVSPGPALFKQKRIGISQKPFTMFKFRTMQPDTDSSIHERYVTELIDNCRSGDAKQQPMTKLVNHPGIIPLGKILRKTYLDEIPQLINVFRGEMSLIGPRPPMAYELKRYPEWCLERFNVPPGMTGLWQVSGKNHLSFDKMIRLDIRYAGRMSLWLDLLILLKTPVAIAMEIVNAIK